MRSLIVIILMLCTWLVSLSAQELSYPVVKVKGQSYYQYTVEEGLGLYAISQHFNTTQELILKANPELSHTGLQQGMVILVPVNEEPVAQIKLEVPTSAGDSACQTSPVVRPKLKRDSLLVRQIPSDSIFMHPVQVEHLLNDSLVNQSIDTIRLAIMLPLQTKAVKPDDSKEKFIDFYIGSLIAIYEAQQSGKHIELYTYDVGKTEQVVQDVVNKETWKKVDAVIGPAYNKQVQVVIDSVSSDSTWILAPFISDLTYTQEYSRVLQFNASSQVQAEAFAKYLLARSSSVNCVLVQTKEGEVVPEGIRAVHEALQSHNISTTTTTIHKILHDSLSVDLVAGKENIIIFNTNKFTNLNILMPHLVKCRQSHKITLYSRYAWQKYDIDIPCIYTSIFAGDAALESQYKDLYKRFFAISPKSSQPRYDLLGYDLTKQLLHILADTTNHNVGETWVGVQSKIKYEPSAVHSGFVNKHVRVVRK